MDPAGAAALLGCGTLYGQRRLHGVWLAMACFTAPLLFPYHFVAMTGGV